MDLVFVYMTCPSESEAQGIVSALLEKRLIACANISAPVRSLYRWQGKIEDSREVAVIMKTRAALFVRVKEAACALHSYECPCIVSWPLGAGHEPFLEWIKEGTDESADPLC